MDMQRVVLKMERNLQKERKLLGSVRYHVQRKELQVLLLSKAENIKEQKAELRSDEIMEALDDKKPLNVREQIRGEDLPPRLHFMGITPTVRLKRKPTWIWLRKSSDIERWPSTTRNW